MSGQTTGMRYLQLVQDYLESGKKLPSADGRTISMTELATLVGVPRQSLYKHPGIRTLVKSAANVCGLSFPENLPAQLKAEAEQTSLEGVEGVGNSRLQASERRVHRLEQQNGALVAENTELRRQLKLLRLEFGREDMAIDSGRRVVDQRRFS